MRQFLSDSTVKLHFSSFFPYSTLKKEVTCAVHTTGVEKLCSASLRAKYLQKLFGILLQGKNLFINHLCILNYDGFMDIYFIFQVKLQYYCNYYSSVLLWLLSLFHVFSSLCFLFRGGEWEEGVAVQQRLTSFFFFFFRGKHEHSPPLPQIMQSSFPHLGKSQGSAHLECNG